MPAGKNGQAGLLAEPQPRDRLRDDKKENNVNPQQLAEVPARRVHGIAVSKQHDRARRKQRELARRRGRFQARANQRIAACLEDRRQKQNK